MTGARDFDTICFIFIRLAFIPMENTLENVIHVTGFGVFRGFTDTNPSWEAVSRLPEAVEINHKRFPIVKHEVPVTYADVNEKIKDIWTQKPKVP